MDAREKIEKLRRMHARNAAREEVRAAFNEAAAAPVVGAKQPDGTIYAGLTPDEKQKIYVMPKDLNGGFRRTFSATAAAVQRLNTEKAFGHDDWQIPSLDTLKVLQKNQNEGALKRTFNAESGGELWFQSWYRSATTDPRDTDLTFDIRFSDGYVFPHHKDSYSFSCRLVRLVPVAAGPRVNH
jgi:hypothetical protein